MRDWIESTIRLYVAGYPGIRRTMTHWDEPLIGFAAAADPLFAEIRQRIGPTHALPTDFLPEARTVIVYYVPLTRETVWGNAPGQTCSRAWAVAYIESQQMMRELDAHLAAGLKRRGHEAMTIPPVLNYNQAKHVSDWSQRHAAYVAGLGTFGLNNMIITGRGCSGRIGSLVTALELPPTPRPAKERCLYKTRGLCQKCMQRCVGAALSPEGFDRYTCYAVCMENAARYQELGFVDACGKCLADLPCTFANPEDSSESMEGYNE